MPFTELNNSSSLNNTKQIIKNKASLDDSATEIIYEEEEEEETSTMRAAEAEGDRSVAYQSMKQLPQASATFVPPRKTGWIIVEEPVVAV